MRSFLLLLFLLFSLSAFSKELSKKDVYFKCEGKIAYSNINPIDIQSSFAIGADYVEQEGNRYTICSESKTTIEFSSSCDKQINERKFDGKIDLILKTINVREDHSYNSTSLSAYKCQTVRNPRN
jgi:hypothetical protein